MYIVRYVTAAMLHCYNDNRNNNKKRTVIDNQYSNMSL